MPGEKVTSISKSKLDPKAPPFEPGKPWLPSNTPQNVAKDDRTRGQVTQTDSTKSEPPETLRRKS
ncbi:hypothetical protein AB5N19_06023 [Seiridium cardinale]|uniref:Uncharacterized protein n=1 Tax=Seiridium cardinale TaxID=138064 RepID=A0ABR2Y632_9PEZI